MLIGNTSATFKTKLDKFNGKNDIFHEPWDCFSFVGSRRTYDFATNNIVAKLDLYLVFSMLSVQFFDENFTRELKF